MWVYTCEHICIGFESLKINVKIHFCPLISLDMYVETVLFYMLISVVMGAEAAKLHRRSQRGQDMLNLTHKIEPQLNLASGETALQDQYLRAQTAKCFSRIRFTYWSIDDSCHHEPPAATSQPPDVWSDARYLLARESEETKFKINSIFNWTFLELLGRYFFFLWQTTVALSLPSWSETSLGVSCSSNQSW